MARPNTLKKSAGEDWGLGTRMIIETHTLEDGTCMVTVRIGEAAAVMTLGEWSKLIANPVASQA